MTARVARLLLCGAVGYVCAGALVALLSVTSAADLWIWAFGVLAFLAGTWVLDYFLPGPSLGLGQTRDGLTAKIVIVVGFIVYWLISQEFIAVIGPGWSVPILFAWTFPAFLVAVAILTAVWPSKRNHTQRE